MPMIQEKETGSGAWYMAFGVVLGAALGVLFAPKVGYEIRADLGDWSRRNGEKARDVLNRLSARMH